MADLTELRRLMEAAAPTALHALFRYVNEMHADPRKLRTEIMARPPALTCASEADDGTWGQVIDYLIALVNVAPALLDAAEERDSLKAEVADLQATFDFRWKADQRATAMWQVATGRERMWPDHADMVIWMLGEIDKLRAECDEARAVVRATLWMAGRYADGRMTSAISTYNEAREKAEAGGYAGDAEPAVDGMARVAEEDAVRRRAAMKTIADEARRLGLDD